MDVKPGHPPRYHPFKGRQYVFVFTTASFIHQQQLQKRLRHWCRGGVGFRAVAVLPGGRVVAPLDSSLPPPPAPPSPPDEIRAGTRGAPRRPRLGPPHRRRRRRGGRRLPSTQSDGCRRLMRRRLRSWRRASSRGGSTSW
jgi:hypothetical protein